jgi:hypothetical protein
MAMADSESQWLARALRTIAHVAIDRAAQWLLIVPSTKIQASRHWMPREP